MSTDTRIRKVALITGASSGMGKDFCFRLIKEGYIVYGAARRSGAMQDLAVAGASTCESSMDRNTSCRTTRNARPVGPRSDFQVARDRVRSRPAEGGPLLLC
jgi:NAD(P)-dependent dehydrogenase (short-subunit alcohol dehydrogenase family)